MNAIPVGGYLEVTFDGLYFSVTQDDSFKCTSSLVKNNEVECNFLRDSAFQVKDLIQTNLVSGQVVDFTINNVNINVKTKMTTSSWTVTTITPDGYAIDRITNGLSLTFPCNLPCQTCSSTNPSYCLSCNALTG